MQDPFLHLLSLFPSQLIDQISAYGLNLQTSPACSPCAWEAQCHAPAWSCPPKLLQPGPFPVGLGWVKLMHP